MLPKDRSKTYKLFMPGHFVDKTTIGLFNGRALDIKLEETIQCFKKTDLVR